MLSLHIAAGALGLILGPLAIAQEQRPPYRSGTGLAYTCAVISVALSGIALVAENPEGLWWLAPLAVLSGALAVLGRVAPGWGTRGWMRGYAHGQGGSYIALVTAALVVSLEGPAQVAAWIAPTVGGVLLIEWRIRRLAGQDAAPMRPLPSTRRS